MVDRSLIGLAGPEFEMDIERGKMREFARAAYAAIPAYVEGRHPVIHPTFLITAASTWGYSLERPRGTVFEEIDHDLSVPLHAEESHQFHGPPPRAGTRLIARSSLEDIRTKTGSRGGELTFLVLLTEFRDESGTPVAETRMTTVTTERAPIGGSSATTVPEYVPTYRGSLDPGDPFAHIAAQAWDDLEEGSGPGIVALEPLSLCDIVRFMGVWGEDNPLHYDVLLARAQGYPTAFGLGMQQASALASYAARWLGPENVRNFQARFNNVFWPGDELTYDGRVARKYEQGGHRFADVSLRCCRDPDDAIVEVSMTFEMV